MKMRSASWSKPMEGTMSDLWYERELDTRARYDGEEGVNNRAYKEGEFMPFYVPREEMPQVDFVDYPALLEFAGLQDVGYERHIMSPDRVQPHQRVVVKKARSMPSDNAVVPILCSQDGFILDGHHRWYNHMIYDKPLDAYVIQLDFRRAVEFLFKFPGTKTLATMRQGEF
jgi:hypothetical protein